MPITIHFFLSYMLQYVTADCLSAVSCFTQIIEILHFFFPLHFCFFLANDSITYSYLLSLTKTENVTCAFRWIAFSGGCKIVSKVVSKS